MYESVFAQGSQSMRNCAHARFPMLQTQSSLSPEGHCMLVRNGTFAMVAKCVQEHWFLAHTRCVRISHENSSE